MSKNLKILCLLPVYNYNDKSRGHTAEYSLIYRSLKKKYNRTNLIDSSSYSKIEDLNKDVLKKVKKINPDILFTCVYSYEIYLETLFEIKKNEHCKIINWSSDDSWRYNQHTSLLLEGFDIAVTSHWKSHLKNKKKINSIYTSWGCPDHWKEKILDSKKCKYDVSFIGNSYMDRKEYIYFLKNNGIRVECFGAGWNNKPVSEKKMLEIFKKSKVSLNFSKSRGNEKQIKARVFEIIGAGGLCLSEDAPNLTKFFKPNKQISLFRNKSELLKRINFFLQNPSIRNQIAKRGNIKIKKNYLNSFIIDEIIKKTLKFKKKKFKPRKELKTNLFLYKILIKICILYKFLSNLLLIIFVGEKKSFKITRRILFEIEWRIRKQKTYTKLGYCSKIFNFD
jgi:spore maturation protein CgeB